MKKTFFALLSMPLMLALASCSKEESMHTASLVQLDKLYVEGSTGDLVTARVTFASNSITKLVITKVVNGVAQPTAVQEIDITDTSTSYLFQASIALGDEKGTLVYTFAGFDKNNQQIDASDLKVKVNLSLINILSAYDWQMSEEFWTVYGDITRPDQLDDINRFNENGSWQFDWGTTLSTGQLETLYKTVSWRIVGDATQIDSLYLTRYNVMDASQTAIEKGFKVIKIDDKSLWLQSGFFLADDLIDKYKAIPRSPGFTPR